MSFVSIDQTAGASTAAIADAVAAELNLYNTVRAAVNEQLGAAGLSLNNIQAILPEPVEPVSGLQRVSGVFPAGATTELKILYAFSGYNYRIYSYRFGVSAALTTIAFAAGEENASLLIGQAYTVGIGSLFVVGPTEFNGVLDCTPDTSVVIRKGTAAAAVTYEVDFEYL